MSDTDAGRMDVRRDIPSKVANGDDLVDIARQADLDEELDLIEQVRFRLELDGTISDVTIAATLAQIAARSETRDRWLAAFGSPLGKHLAMRGSDLNTSLNTLLALAPRAQA